MTRAEIPGAISTVLPAYERDRNRWCRSILNLILKVGRKAGVSSCPFVNLPEKTRTQWALTNEEMKNWVWLKPALVAQIEFTEWTPDGHLRHSKFVGLRDDKDAKKVVREIED